MTREQQLYEDILPLAYNPFHGGDDECTQEQAAQDIVEICKEYAQQEAIAFLMWKSSKGYYSQGATQHTTNDTPIWIRQENQLVFSTPISSNKLYELYDQSKNK